MLEKLRNLLRRSKKVDAVSSSKLQPPPPLPNKLAKAMQGVEWFLVPSGALDQGPFEVGELWSRYHCLAEKGGARLRRGVAGKAIGKAIPILADEGPEPALLRLCPPAEEKPTAPTQSSAGSFREFIRANPIERQRDRSRSSDVASQRENDSSHKIELVDGVSARYMKSVLDFLKTKHPTSKFWHQEIPEPPQDFQQLAEQSASQMGQSIALAVVGPKAHAQKAILLELAKLDLVGGGDFSPYFLTSKGKDTTIIVRQ